jgi:hypothetical protein
MSHSFEQNSIKKVINTLYLVLVSVQFIPHSTCLTCTGNIWHYRNVAAKPGHKLKEAKWLLENNE